jgi:hypothetical protein
MIVMNTNSEVTRLHESREAGTPWKKWGPYLSERQWGTVREDYSTDGNAWAYFSHDQARSRAYHWGEDGIAGISDDKQQLCFALALWNGKDPILKERMFGLTNSEGNHGEDVKEYYFYLDSTPTHSYMKCLYKYPQAAFPYDDLIRTNRARTRQDFEYELLDTGIFNEDRYFDVFVEYAKNTPEDILIKITAANRGPEDATLHILPTLWFRNMWSFWADTPKPSLTALDRSGRRVVEASHHQLGKRYLYCESNAPLLFTENETNNAKLFGDNNSGPHVKDGINELIVNGNQDAVNSSHGTKAAVHHEIRVKKGSEAVVRLRLSDRAPEDLREPLGREFDEILRARRTDADEFYQSITPAKVNGDQARVMRQALAGMLWSKQYFGFNVDKWLEEHGIDPMRPGGHHMRNGEWFHMVNDDIISMPDKWEYPWYAAWDLAFHAIALSTVDTDFAKEQLDLMLQHLFLHPSGQMPAYEWNFSDVNPPVHAWSTIFLYRTEQAMHGRSDLEFLKRSFRKLMLNFTWWVNRKDRFGKNLFEGGFLGLDNIGVFDRSAPLPGGGHLEQADGTAWMALFCQNMLEISLELAGEDPSYEDMVTKFIDHFLWIANAMNTMGSGGMWDEEEGFYYDVLRRPNGSAARLKVRSLVGLLPICATTVFEAWQRERVPKTVRLIQDRLKQMPELFRAIHPPRDFGIEGRTILALVDDNRLRRILSAMLDENEFFGPYGIRAISRVHLDHPYVFVEEGQKYNVNYLPAESDTGMFGGNSNWRGPVWMPMNALLIRALLNFYVYHGDNFKVECPTGSGRMMNLFEVARELANRLIGIFTADASGRRPVYGGTQKFQTDPNWKDYLLFYEYFHGDNGAGLGASHQTGWTGVVAKLIEIFGRMEPAGLLATGRTAAYGQKEAVKRAGG